MKSKLFVSALCVLLMAIVTPSIVLAEGGLGDTPWPTYGYDLRNTGLELVALAEERASDSLNLTANVIIPMVGIELNRDSVDYGTLLPGENSTVETVGITNIGTVGVDVSLEVQGADATAQSFYEQSLYIDGAKYNMTTVIASIPVEGSEDVDTQLQVPLSWAEPGVQDATCVFWAEASP
jgi:hypothetical protein